MDGAPPSSASSESAVWHCFPEAEIPIWKCLFRKPDTSVALARLDADLQAIFEAEPGITQVEEP